jgi:hypothetical protein
MQRLIALVMKGAIAEIAYALEMRTPRGSQQGRWSE